MKEQILPAFSYEVTNFTFENYHTVLFISWNFGILVSWFHNLINGTISLISRSAALDVQMLSVVCGQLSVVNWPNLNYLSLQTT